MTILIYIYKIVCIFCTHNPLVRLQVSSSFFCYDSTNSWTTTNSKRINKCKKMCRSWDNALVRKEPTAHNVGIAIDLAFKIASLWVQSVQSGWFTSLGILYGFCEFKTKKLRTLMKNCPLVLCCCCWLCVLFLHWECCVYGKQCIISVVVSISRTWKNWLSPSTELFLTLRSR